jgi:hypothetical protein
MRRRVGGSMISRVPLERARERIAGPGPRIDPEPILRGNREEARVPVQHRGPDAAFGVGSAEDHEPPVGREGAGDLGDLPAHDPSDPLRVGEDAGAALHLQLPLVIRAHQKNPHDGAPPTGAGAARPAAPVGL